MSKQKFKNGTQVIIGNHNAPLTVIGVNQIGDYLLQDGDKESHYVIPVDYLSIYEPDKK